MSRIDNLISEFCGDGVTFGYLGDLGRTYGGLTGKVKSDFTEGNARFVSYRNIFNNISVDLEAKDFVQIQHGEHQNHIELGDVLITGSSETQNDVGMSSVVVEDPPNEIYLNSFCFGFRLNNTSLLIPGFLKYVFRSDGIRKQIVRCASGVTRFNVSKKRFSRVRIPLPPLEVQQEIETILDRFTELEQELEVELEARIRQYRYYRDVLLSFSLTDIQVRTTRLGEIAKYSKTRIPSSEMTSDSFIGVDNLLPDFKGKVTASFTPNKGTCIEYEAEDILIGNIRPYLKKIWIADSMGGASPDVLVVHRWCSFVRQLFDRFKL